MARWILGTLAVFFAVLCLTALLTGNPGYIIPVAILAALVFAYAIVNWVLARRVTQEHRGDWGEAMADSDDPVPSAHLIPDDTRPLGDTPEAHDEINPHDLPVDHPGRGEAERQADERTRGEARTTRGDQELADAPPAREERLGDRRRPRDAGPAGGRREGGG